MSRHTIAELDLRCHNCIWWHDCRGVDGCYSEGGVRDGDGVCCALEPPEGKPRPHYVRNFMQNGNRGVAVTMASDRCDMWGGREQ